ncbi:MAG: urease accessory protein UreD [Acidimicrobiales bacterium]|nr:urease accessory protein UreD [Acidimicrobiales bacterium]
MDPLADGALDRRRHELSGSWTDTEVSVRLSRGAGGATRVEGVLCSAPVWTRWDGDTLWLIGSGASPVGEDHIRVRVDVGPGVAASVRSVAATMVYAARGVGTRWDTEIHVADDAHLDWRPEPVILTGRSRHRATTRIHAGTGSTVTLDEVVVLGRVDEPTGALCSTLDVRVADTPVLLTSLDTTLPGWSGPAGTAGASVVANRLHSSPDGPRTGQVEVGGATLLEPAPTCRVAVAAAHDVPAARHAVETLLPSPGTRPAVHEEETNEQFDRNRTPLASCTPGGLPPDSDDHVDRRGEEVH